MNVDLPEFYFRVRENGAAVFRVNTETRQSRIELNQIAVANWKNGDIRPQGDHKLSSEERVEIERWLEERRALLAQRDVDDILRSVDHLNLATQWAQAKATDEQLEMVTDQLLLTMHDMRQVLVRKKAERIMKAQKAAE